MLEDGEYGPNEDNTNYKAIACERIPELFLDKIVAKKYFSKFGKIKRFILRPKRLSCTVEYENEQFAKNACTNAGNFNGIDFDVSYAEHEVAHVQNTEEWVDPDVQSELDAMSLGHRLTTNVRPSTGMIAQTIQKPSALNRVSKYPTSLASSPKSIKVCTTGRSDSPQPDITKIDINLRNELEALMRTPAFTDEEKYRVLDARDKLIRLTTVRQTDIKKAVATRGTCPDMCPEKERLMREFQRQVSTFELAEEECSESTISHKKAVKEYSRSSADQEVPLSHELRSESVLQMTMLYLVHRVMGLCDDPKTSLGDWFHFVWDRTRSIRKDITQQELCSLGAVQLVERCARFHIHCAARLVAEDPSVFDKKINAENLTKCLQTLKYMYHDLRIKGIRCPCESEFRSYVILLNLGDSNFLWEVKQLPELIQKSVEVKRAIAFYNALQNNNFVRFFLMIKSSDTSYLSACILLGYFTKLRVRAMDAIIKSHNWRKNDVYLPLSYLTRVLGFDDKSSAVSFFNSYGLHCDVVDNRVLLDRLSKPDIEYAMERALQLVESKRQVSVGECVFGEALPPASLFENHQPHSSFDGNGMLKLESWTADDQLSGKTEKEKIQNKDKPEMFGKDHGDIHLFKMPQNLVPVFPKLQKQQKSLQQEHTLDSILLNKEEKFTSPGGFKFGGNVFGGPSTKKSIFNSSLSSKNSEKSSNAFPKSIFKTNTEKPATMGDVFSGIATNVVPKTTNIFEAAARETANIFKNDVPKEIFTTDSVFRNFQSNTENTFLQYISNKSKIEEDNVLRNKLADEDSSLEKELQESFKRDEERKRQFEELELKNFQERQKLQEDEENKVKEIEKLRMQKLKLILQQKAESESEQTIAHFVDEEVSRIASAEVLISQMVQQASYLQKESILSEVLNSSVEEIAYEEYALMCYDQLLLNRYFSRWLQHLRKKKEQRKLMESTPLWATTDTRAQYVESIEHPCQQSNLLMMKRYRFGQPCDLREILNLEQDNFFEHNQNPLNLFALVGQHLLSNRNFSTSGLLQQRYYFKFLITLPENKEELFGFESFSNKWLTRFVEKSQTETGPFVHGIEHNVALCVRKLNGIVPKNEQGDVMTTEGDHNDGIVCFITGIDIEKHSRKRLYNLLKLTKNFKRVPLSIIAYNCTCNKEELAARLGLDLLQEEGLIHTYTIFGCQTNKKDFSFRKIFIKAVNFITKESHLINSNEIQALAMQNVLPFLEATLGEEMWQRWCDSAKRNPIFNKICNLPQHVVGIFHKALDHLLHITQEDLEEMPEFPEELKEFIPDITCSDVPVGVEFFPLNWKDKTKKTVIKNFVESLYLPKVEEKHPENIEDLKLWLLNYTSKFITDEQSFASVSHEAITNLVNQIKHQYFHYIEAASSIDMINYLKIIKPIIFAHINNKLKHFQKELINLNIIYLKDDLNNYQTQPWWLNYDPLNCISVNYSENSKSLNLSGPPLQNKKEECISVNDVGNIIAKAEATSRKAEETLSCFKRKQCNFQNSSSTLQLKRTLEDSIYQFELSKKIGQYDTSFATDLTDAIDKSINEVFSQSPPEKGKRKKICLKTQNQCSDIDSVIAKAMNVIHKIESSKDHKFRKEKKY